MSFRVFVHLLDGDFFAVHTTPSGWTHIVVNYAGPNEGEGIRIDYDGTEVVSDTTKGTWSRSTGDGRIVVGRYATDRDIDYASVMVDELLFFNQALSVDDTETLYQSV